MDRPRTRRRPGPVRHGGRGTTTAPAGVVRGGSVADDLVGAVDELLRQLDAVLARGLLVQHQLEESSAAKPTGMSPGFWPSLRIFTAISPAWRPCSS